MKAIELFRGAKWMSPGNSAAPCIRGRFRIEGTPVKARLVFCGLGMYDLAINGKSVTDDLYGNWATDYAEWEGENCVKSFGEKLGHRTYVKEYDVLDMLGKDNCIAIMLGHGWYNNEFYGGPDGNRYGDLVVCYLLELTYADGSRKFVMSDDSLKWTESNLISWNLFRYEHYDYSYKCLDSWRELDFDDSDWKPLTEIDAPKTEFYFTDCPPDKVIRTIEPKLIRETDELYIYDMGENITGTPIIRARELKAGQKLELSVSERLDENGMIEEYTHHWQDASFITDDKPRDFALRFTWFGFRYASVTKNAEIVSCNVTHIDMPVTSSFKSSNKVLDWLYDAFLRTQLDNTHMGIPSDCPHLERRGYTGDGELVCESGMLLFDSKAFYRKWLYDIYDCQDRISGHVQYTAPYTPCGGGPGGWGCAIVEVPYTYYKTYGDESVLEEFFEPTMRYFDYLDAHSENDLVVSDQPKQWCLGDWCTAEEIAIPAPYVNNYFYVKSIDRLLEFCSVLGRSEDAKLLRARRAVKVKAILDNYYDPTTGNFCNAIQGSNAFALDIGLGDERTLAQLVNFYENEPWYDTGIFGTDILTRVLFEKGQNDLAYKLMSSEGKYSFGKWMNDGYTTLPEYWTYQRSQNHPMFGAVTRYLFTYLLGIGGDVGFRSIVIDPHFAKGLDRAEGYLTTAVGKIGVAYEKCGGKLSIKVEVPANVPAKLVIGGKDYALVGGMNEFEF